MPHYKRRSLGRSVPTYFAVLSALVTFSLGNGRLRGAEPAVIGGPITNTITGSIYYLLDASTWQEAETKSVSLGGHLVTINDDFEEGILMTTFGFDQSTFAVRSLWIGLRRESGQSEFSWVSGQTSSFSSWLDGEPDVGSGTSAYALYATLIPGFVDDVGYWIDSPSPITDQRLGAVYGIAEVPLVVNPPTITEQPVGSLRRDTGSSISLTVTASGIEPFSYQWFKDGQPITNATTASLIHYGAKTEDSGIYHVVVSNSGGSTQSANAVVTVRPGVTISVQPADTTVINGQSVSFAVATEGATASSLQWFHNAEPVAGAVGSTLSIAEADGSHAGIYHVRATFANDVVVSEALNLVVHPVPVAGGGTNLPPRFVAAGISRPMNLQSIKVDWFSEAGRRYAVEQADDVTGPWRLMNNRFLDATGVVSSVQVPMTGRPSGFTRIREADTEPPAFDFIFPSTNGFAVSSNAALRVAVYDESELDVSRLVLTTPSGSEVRIGDPRLTFTNDVMIFNPGTNIHAAPGGTAAYSVSAIDVLGNASGEVPWSFQIAQDVVLADGAIGIGADQGTNAIQQITSSSVQLSYQGVDHGFSTNQLIWSDDSQYPFYRRITGITADSASKIITLQTVAVPLHEIIRDGGLSTSQLIEVTGPVRQPSGFLDDLAEGEHSIGHRFSVGDSYEETFDLGGPVTLEETFAWSLDFDLAASVQISEGALRRARIALTPSFSHSQSETLAVSVSTNLSGSKTVFSDSKLFYAGQIGPVPIWIELEQSIIAGYSVAASASGSISRSANMKVSSVWEATYDGVLHPTNRWQLSRRNLPTEFSYSRPDWQLEGELAAQVYLAPTIGVELLSLAGVAGTLTPSLNLDASFQGNPLAYQWTLYGKLDASVSPSIEFWPTNFANLPTWNFPVSSNYIAGDKYPDAYSITALEGLTETNEHGVPTGEISEAEVFSIKVVDTAFAIEDVQYRWYRGNVLLPILGSVFSARGNPGLTGDYRVVATKGTNSDSRSFELTLRQDETPPEVFRRAITPQLFSFDHDYHSGAGWGHHDVDGAITLSSKFHVTAEDPESGIKDYAHIAIPTRLAHSYFELVTNALSSSDVYWTSQSSPLTGHIDDTGRLRVGPPLQAAPGETFYLWHFARNNRGLFAQKRPSYNGDVYRICKPMAVVHRQMTYTNEYRVGTNYWVDIPGVCRAEFIPPPAVQRGMIFQPEIEDSFILVFGTSRSGAAWISYDAETESSDTGLHPWDIYRAVRDEEIDYVYLIRPEALW